MIERYVHVSRPGAVLRPVPRIHTFGIGTADRDAEKRSQGGVKVPTGGKWRKPRARERREAKVSRVSRFGAIPKPTVTVRMEENG